VIEGSALQIRRSVQYKVGSTNNDKSVAHDRSETIGFKIHINVDVIPQSSIHPLLKTSV
jgi:hypothetical protein